MKKLFLTLFFALIGASLVASQQIQMNPDMTSYPFTPSHHYHGGWRNNWGPWWGSGWGWPGWGFPWPHDQGKFCRIDADCPQIRCIKAPCPQYRCIYGTCRMLGY